MHEPPPPAGHPGDIPWQQAPWRPHTTFLKWRPLQVGDRSFKIPVVGGRHVRFELLQERWQRELFQGLMPRDGGGFVDVGVNLGHTVIDLQCAAPGSRYVGFEPNVAGRAYVNELLQLNRITGRQVVPAALAGADAVAFDDVRRDLMPDPVRFVKIDVEGAALEVLRGMRATLASDRPMVLCEVLFTASGGDMEAQRVRNEALQAELVGQRYVILHIIKTRTGDLVGGSRIKEFPQAFWSASNKHQCDYLFAPEEDLRRAAKVLY